MRRYVIRRLGSQERNEQVVDLGFSYAFFQRIVEATSRFIKSG